LLASSCKEKQNSLSLSHIAQGENAMATRTKVWDQKIKNVVRKQLLKKRGRPFRTALFMPANTAYCVEEAKNSGMINDETELILVDRDSTTLSLGYHRCVEVLDHEEDWTQLRRGKVEDVLRYLRPDDVAVTDGWCDYLEFLYLDTCGELSPTMVDALKTAVENKVITEKTTIAFTFATAQRMWDVSGWTARHFTKENVGEANNLLKFSKDDKRNTVCQIISNTIRHAIGRPDAEIAFGCAYKERGNGFPMMTAIILGKGYKHETENPYADLGYNGNHSHLEP